MEMLRPRPPSPPSRKLGLSSACKRKSLHGEVAGSSCREQFADAHALVTSDQARAGLDILTTGDYHLDEDVAGRSWHHYPLQRWKGLAHEELQTSR
jgi:hypothetical protein